MPLGPPKRTRRQTLHDLDSGSLPLGAAPASLWTADGSSLKLVQAIILLNSASGVMGVMVEGMTWASGPLPQLVPAGESRICEGFSIISCATCVQDCVCSVNCCTMCCHFRIGQGIDAGRRTVEPFRPRHRSIQAALCLLVHTICVVRL